MSRILKASGIIVAIIAAVAITYYALYPKSPESAGERLARELTPEEQARIDESTFTPETLAEFDGRDGRPAYIAVNGIVYDVSDRWKDGGHHGLSAGHDVTEGFLSSPHGHAVLQELEVVGGYEERGA